MDKFSEDLFEQKLLKLKDTHDSIANLSSWCLTNQQHHDKIVSSWLTVLKRVKIEQRVTLFYLANDVVQYSKKKGLPFVDSFAPAFQKAVTMVREDAIRGKMERLFSIWKQRGIYDENFLVDLNGLLARDKTNRIDISEFQPQVLYSRLRSCKELEDDTDIKLRILTHNHISLTDVEKMRTSLKDRDSGSDLIPEVEDGMQKIKDYIYALEAEIKERVGLIDLLEVAEVYYADQLKEAKVVVNAYKCFGGRVKGVSRKLEERVQELPSPQLSPDVNAPSPSPSPENNVKNDISFYGMNFSSGSSFMDGSLMTNNYLAKALGDESFVSEPSSVVSHNHSTSSDQTIHHSTPVQTPTSVKNNRSKNNNNNNNNNNINESSSHKSTPYGIISPINPNANIPQSFTIQPIKSKLSQLQSNLSPYSPSQSFGSNQTIPDYTPPPVNRPKYVNEKKSNDNDKINEHRYNTTMEEGNKIEVVTRSQIIDKKMTLSDILQSLLPNNEASGLPEDTANGILNSNVENTPRSPSPESSNHVLPSNFPVWNEVQPNDWESPVSPPIFEKTGYPLADNGMRVIYEDDTTVEDTSMGKDVDHRNLISLTGNCDTDYRKVSNLNCINQDHAENMDISDDDEDKGERIRVDHHSKYSYEVSAPAEVPSGVVVQPPSAGVQQFHQTSVNSHNIPLDTPPPITPTNSNAPQFGIISTPPTHRPPTDITIPPPSPFKQTIFPTPPPPSINNDIQISPNLSIPPNIPQMRPNIPLAPNIPITPISPNMALTPNMAMTPPRGRNRPPVSVNFYQNKLAPPLPTCPPPPPPPLPPQNHWNPQSPSHLRFPPPYVVDHHHRHPNHIPIRHHHSYKQTRTPNYQRITHFPRW